MKTFSQFFEELSPATEKRLSNLQKTKDRIKQTSDNNRERQNARKAEVEQDTENRRAEGRARIKAQIDRDRARYNPHARDYRPDAI